MFNEAARKSVGAKLTFFFSSVEKVFLNGVVLMISFWQMHKGCY